MTTAPIIRSDVDQTVDKSTWPAGPWLEEPDLLDWAAGNVKCAIRRNGAGAFCGYVGIWAGHQWAHEHYRDIDVDVHGGLTFADAQIHHAPPYAGPAEWAPVWWIGFDCGHLRDYLPGFVDYLGTRGRYGGTYRDINYVFEETSRLAGFVIAAWNEATNNRNALP